MFQYTHELVINSLNTAISKKNADNSVTIERGGEYKAEFVQGGVIWKTAPVQGALDKITLKVAGLGLVADTDYALNIFVKLVDPHAFFEYGYPNWNTFGKQILVSFTATGTAADDAQLILDSILPAAIENDLTFVKGEVSGTDVVLEVGNYGLRFDSVGLSTYDPTTCDSCVGEYMNPEAILDRGDWANVTASKIAHTTVGQDPFGTGEWLRENLRFPSYPNIRYAAVGEDNYPIPGASYTMYSFAYESPRPGLGGLSGVGQAVTAVTRHIYYVHSSAVSDFDTLLGNLGTVTTTNPATPVPTAANARTEKAVNEKEDKS